MTSTKISIDEPKKPSDRRLRRRREWRNHIYEAAITKFVELGYDRTTMGDIAEHADVARATVFNHFARKSEFLDEWGARRRARVASALEARSEQASTRETLHGYMQELAAYSVESRRETVALMGAVLSSINVLDQSAFARDLSRFLARGQERGEVRPDLDPAWASLYLTSCYYATITQWVAAEPPPFDLGAALRSMLDLVLDGILAPGAAQR